MSGIDGTEVRVVICGSNYGAMYALALCRLPGFRLIGVIARGSRRSINLAKRMGVPLYRNPAEVTSPVDIAVVAVGDRAANALIVDFLARGVHVLAEHPIGPKAVEAAFRAARQSGACFHVNAHWGDLPPARTFVEECAQARRRSPPVFVSLQTSARLFYSSIDLALRVLGPADKFHRQSMATIRVPPSATDPAPDFQWHCTSGLLGGVPCVLQRSLRTSPHDDGSDFLVMHRISVTFADGGNVLLGEASGPVIRFSEYVPDTRTLYTSTRPDSLPECTRDLMADIACRGGTMWHNPDCARPVTFANHLGIQRLEANQLALRRLWEQVTNGVVAPEQGQEHILATARICSQLARQMQDIVPHYGRTLKSQTLRSVMAAFQYIGLASWLVS